MARADDGDDDYKDSDDDDAAKRRGTDDAPYPCGMRSFPFDTRMSRVGERLIAVLGCARRP